MKILPLRISLFFSLAVLGACGSDSPTSPIAVSTARGTLVENPPFRIASLDAAAFQAQLAASAFAPFLPLTGAPVCGVDFNYMHYWTVGGTGEAEEVSGALMVPTGAAPQCSGPRPIVLYAHGTQVLKAVNIADPTDPNNDEGVLIAAMFAAQGYIVVAPNYVGYDSSSAAYHPFLNEDAQSKDMIDALTAARSALGKVLASTTTDNGKLFITGYSQGGYVAMATHKAMQAAHMTVTAAGTMSGPYALEATGDFTVTGHVGLYSTLFYPMLITSYERAYGNAYGSPGATTADFYEAAYAPTIEALLPSYTPVDGPNGLIAQGKIPALALFNIVTPVTGNPALDALLAEPPLDPNHPENVIFRLGFGTGNLIKNEVRVAYVSDAVLNPDIGLQTLSDCILQPPDPNNPNCTQPGPSSYGPAAAAPTYGLRDDLYINDLRNWIPAAPRSFSNSTMPIRWIRWSLSRSTPASCPCGGKRRAYRSHAPRRLCRPAWWRFWILNRAWVPATRMPRSRRPSNRPSSTSIPWGIRPRPPLGSRRTRVTRPVLTPRARPAGNPTWFRTITRPSNPSAKPRYAVTSAASEWQPL